MKPANLLIYGGLIALAGAAPLVSRAESGFLAPDRVSAGQIHEDRSLETILLPHYTAVDSVIRSCRGDSLDGDEVVSIMDIENQQMYVVSLDEQGSLKIVDQYGVSTSKFGVGSTPGSNRTPLGVHRIKERIGGGQPRGMTFKGRQPTGRIANIRTCDYNVPSDAITSRILWLDGLQEENDNSHSRYIYIHGTNEEGLVGNTPASYGCPRMTNDDVIEFFDFVADAEAYVNIVESLD